MSSGKSPANSAATAAPSGSTRVGPPTAPILLTTLDLTNAGAPGKLVWQFIYASQLYQTLFSIYANFRTTSNGGVHTLVGADLKLVNYQGVVNIGFTNDMPVYKRQRDKLYFGVRGASMLTEISFDFPKPADVDAPPTVMRGTPYQLTFCRMLYPMLAFDYPLGLRAAPDSTLTDAIPTDPLFDTEFHHRSGLEFYNRVERPGMYNYDSLDLDAIRLQNPIASIRCHESTVNLTA